MSESKTPTPEPLTNEQLDAYLQLAENIRERFGDNWQLVDDEDMDEVSVRTEDSTFGLYTEMFVTSQVHGEDPLEVAGFLAAAIDNVPRMAAMIRQAEAECVEAREQVKRVREVAAYFRDREAHLKERYDQATNDAQATALLSSAALIGDAAHRIERALDGTEAGS